MRACEILPRILIDNLHCFKHTWNSNVDAYHGKWAFMPSSVLELLPNFKSTYFANMNPPNEQMETIEAEVQAATTALKLTEDRFEDDDNADDSDYDSDFDFEY